MLAGLLAALGIYGVLAYLVVQRTREIGIRMALGAAAREVRSLIFKEVGFMVIAGCAVGLPVAYAFARLSQSLLYGVQPTASISICWLSRSLPSSPRPRAICRCAGRSSIDPIIALRYE